MRAQQNWCLSAILSLIFSLATALIFFWPVLAGSGNDGYLIIYCIYTAPVAVILGLWGLFYWQSIIAFTALLICASPLIYLRLF